MPNKSSIEWVATYHPDGTITPGYTSNPVYAISIETGKRGHHCVHKNALCVHCYAESINLRWGTGLHFTAQNGDKVRFALSVKELDNLSKLDARLTKRGETAKVFMFDMTDIGLPGIPRAFIFAVLERIATLKALTIQLLTKRPGEVCQTVREYCAAHGLSPTDFKGIFAHVHMGASVGTQRTADEDVPELLKLGRFFGLLWLSLEPLLEAVDVSRFFEPTGFQCIDPDCIHRYLPLVNQDDYETWGKYSDPICLDCGQVGSWTGYEDGIGWGVIGGESGNSARPTSVKHVRAVSEQFKAARRPRFVKQLGSRVHGDPRHFPTSKIVRAPSGGPHAGYIFKLKDSKGGAMDEWPADLRVREFPSPLSERNGKRK